MINESLTEIFPSEILPARSGVYKTLSLDEDGNPQGDWGYSFFDATDRVWGCTYATVDEAWQRPDYEFAQQTKTWFGLAEETKV